jgi:hypothetical protein
MNEFDIVALSNRYNEVFYKIKKSKWGYCHKKSVGNFIFHLERIKGKGEKMEIFKRINHYLDKVEVFGDEADMSFSISLFNDHLNYICNVFQNRLSFIIILPLKALLVFIPALFLIYYLSSTNIYILCIISFILIGYLLILFHKTRRRKVYGFGY